MPPGLIQQWRRQLSADFLCCPGASLTATNLVLTNGSYIKNDSTALTNADGGAIYIDSGTVNMTGCMLANNNVQSIVLARGGAIFNTEARLTLVETIMAGNNATATGFSQYPTVRQRRGLRWCHIHDEWFLVIS